MRQNWCHGSPKKPFKDTNPKKNMPSTPISQHPRLNRLGAFPIAPAQTPRLPPSMFPNAGQRQPKLKSRAQARIKKP
jgi:hypothetical protein